MTYTNYQLNIDEQNNQLNIAYDNVKFKKITYKQFKKLKTSRIQYVHKKVQIFWYKVHTKKKQNHHIKDD